MDKRANKSTIKAGCSVPSSLAVLSSSFLFLRKLPYRFCVSPQTDPLGCGRQDRQSQVPFYGGDLRRDVGVSNAVLTIWQISFDYIRSKRPSAADLLSLMSFFDRQGIPEWVLKPYRTLNDVIPTVTSCHWCRHPWRCRRRLAPARTRLDGTDDQMDSGFEDDVVMLRDYCLIAATEGGEEFEMHWLVQLSTRRWLEAFKQQDTFKQQYIKRIATSFPTGEYKNWATCQTLFAHVQVVLGDRRSKDTLETWATLLHNGGCYADSQGKYEVAQQMLGEARQVREKKMGKKATATLQSISMFAIVLHHQGRWKEAESLEVQVMETRKRVLGEDYPDTLTSMNNLAFT
ncbi:hypothetical protein V8F33_010488 [Rhypophila sp. PSN 637]